MPGLQRPRKREHASINVAVGDRSSINYIMPMVAGSAGYEPTLEAHLDTVAITSSLNDIRLVSAESCRVSSSRPLLLLFLLQIFNNYYPRFVANFPRLSGGIKRERGMSQCFCGNLSFIFFETTLVCSLTSGRIGPLDHPQITKSLFL